MGFETYGIDKQNIFYIGKDHLDGLVFQHRYQLGVEVLPKGAFVSVRASLSNFTHLDHELQITDVGRFSED